MRSSTTLIRSANKSGLFVQLFMTARLMADMKVNLDQKILVYHDQKQAASAHQSIALSKKKVAQSTNQSE